MPCQVNDGPQSANGRGISLFNPENLDAPQPKMQLLLREADTTESKSASVVAAQPSSELLSNDIKMKTKMKPELVLDANPNSVMLTVSKHETEESFCEFDSAPKFREVEEVEPARKPIKLFSSSNEVVPLPEDGKYFKLRKFYYLPDITRGKIVFKVHTRR